MLSNTHPGIILFRNLMVKIRISTKESISVKMVDIPVDSKFLLFI